MNCKVLITALLIWINNSSAQKNELLRTGAAIPNFCPNVSDNIVASFYDDANDAKVVQIAAKSFATDVNLFSGKQLKTYTTNSIINQSAIVAGAIGQSKVIDGSIKQNIK